MSKTRTNAGIRWTQDSIAAFAKVVSHRLAVDKFQTWYPECSEKDLRGPEGWARYAGKGASRKGFLGKDSRDELVHRVCLLVPEFKDYFKERSEHKGDIAEVVAHRVRNSIMNNEMRRFREMAWRPLYRSVAEAVSSGRSIDIYQRHQVHEEVVLLQAGDRPGVYCNINPDNPRWCRIGKASNIRDRNVAHRNGPMFCVRAYITETPTAAGQLERSIFEKLESLEMIRDCRNPNGRSAGNQGALLLVDDAVKLVDWIVSEHYSNFCRAKGAFRAPY